MSTENQLSRSDRIALHFSEARKNCGLPLEDAELGAICAFTAWLLRNYDVYELDEVNRG